jgi:hypothetical protein
MEEQEIKVVAGSPPITRDITLNIGTEVTLDPITPIQGSIQVAVPSLIRLQPAGSTWKTFGNTSALGPFRAILDPVFEYQVLVIPEAAGMFANLPPYLLSRETTNGIKVTSQYLALVGGSLAIGPGITIQGRVTANGQPMAKARVVLQSGLLFSVGGETDAQGNYTLNVNPGGVFSISVIPPAHAEWLSTASIDQGIVLTDLTTQVPPIDFDWTTPPITGVTLNLKWRNGSPRQLQDCTILLESLPNTLPNVGTLNVTGVFPATLAGKIRMTPKADAEGVVTLPQLPLLKYKVTIAPPLNTTGTGGGNPDAGTATSLSEAAITTFLLDLTKATTATTLTVPLDEKVPVNGRLTVTDAATLQAAEGSLLTATDLDAVPFPTTLSTTLSRTGAFTFPDASPGRTYSLRAYPPAGKGFPDQVLLIGFTTIKGNNVLDNQRLPTGVQIGGKISFANGPVGGASVQVFCIGALPHCLNQSDPSQGSPQPIAQARTKLDGTYEVWIADPGTAR